VTSGDDAGGAQGGSAREQDAEALYANVYSKDIARWCGVDLPFSVDWVSFKDHYVRDDREAMQLEFDQAFDEDTAVTYCGSALKDLLNKACFDIDKQGPTKWVPTVRAKIKALRCKYDAGPRPQKFERDGKKPQYEVGLELKNGVLTVGVYGGTINSIATDYEWDWFRENVGLSRR
jgi:hypothetical protein